jgi:hypothetical protein
MMKELSGVIGTLLTSAGLALGQAAIPSATSPTPAAEHSSPAITHAPVCDDLCCPQPCGERIYGSVDYLLWWVKDGPQSTPLVTTGPSNVLFSGALDIPGTQVLFGGNGLDYGQFSGGRLLVGMWLDNDSSLGVEAGGFLLEERSVGFTLAGDANGQPFFGRPFINALTGNQNVYFVSQNFSDPALSARMTGAIDIASSSQLWGWETNGVVALGRADGLRVDALAGFRSVGLSEDLRVQEEIRNLVPGGGVFFLGSNVDPSASVANFSRFKTTNRFYGPQIGGRLDWQGGGFSLGVVGKLGLGVSHQEVTIDGGSVLLNSARQPLAAAVGGVNALSSNIGQQSHNAFAVVPEVGVNVGVQLAPQLRAWVGYTFLYISDVARPGEQLDPVLNPGLVPTDATFGTPGGPALPAPLFNTTDFWAQGINFGMEFRY